MKKVIIFELYSHHVFIVTVSRILNSIGYNITICTTENIYKDIKEDIIKFDIKPTYLLKEENENLIKFFYKINKKLMLNKYDFVFYNTIQGWAMLKFLFIFKRSKIISANGRLSEWFNISFLPKNRNSLRNIIYHYYSWLLSKWYLYIVDGMIFHTDMAFDIALKSNYPKPIIKIPFSFANELETNIQRGNILRFVLTGSMNPLSRDYLGFFNELLVSDNIAKDKIIFYILSEIPKNNYGVRCFQLINKLRLEGYNIITYDTWIDEKMYKEVIDQANFLVALINYRKYYYSGELTSTLVDSIRHLKPAIYPLGYMPEYQMRECSIFYNNIKELIHIICKIQTDNNILNFYQDNLNKISSEYKISFFKKNFNNFLNKIYYDTNI
jgi:hypothetical protein